MKTTRAFLAIELSDEIHSALASLLINLQSKIPSGVRWVPVNNIHLTIKFLGEIPDDRIESLKKELLMFFPNISHFPISVSNLGVFPSYMNPRIIWVGVQNNPSLQQMAAECERVTQINGIPNEVRPFSPHLTIGRVLPSLSRENLKILGSTLKSIKYQQEVTQNVEKLTLFKSDLTPAGSIYSRLAVIALG
jgi:RNA 2',3'-cyclic 3'-phosphodiesterase